MLKLKYPNGIFILNVRKMDKWLISRLKHGLRSGQRHSWARPVSINKCSEWIEEIYSNL